MAAKFVVGTTQSPIHGHIPHPGVERTQCEQHDPRDLERLRIVMVPHVERVEDPKQLNHLGKRILEGVWETRPPRLGVVDSAQVLLETPPLCIKHKDR